MLLTSLLPLFSAFSIVDLDFLDALELVATAVVVAAVEGTLFADDQHAAVGHAVDAPLAEDFLRRLVALAIVPPERNGGPFGRFRELELDDRTGREAVVVVTRGLGDDGDRIAQSAGGERDGHLVAGHVAQGTAAEVPPTAPLEAVVQAGPVFALRSDTQPVLPIEPFQSLARFPASSLQSVARHPPDSPVLAWAANFSMVMRRSGPWAQIGRFDQT